MMSFHNFGIEICICYKSDYRLLVCQASDLLVIWIKFCRGWYKTSKNIKVTSFHNILSQGSNTGGGGGRDPPLSIARF